MKHVLLVERETIRPDGPFFLAEYVIESKPKFNNYLLNLGHDGVVSLVDIDDNHVDVNEFWKTKTNYGRMDMIWIKLFERGVHFTFRLRWIESLYTN